MCHDYPKDILDDLRKLFEISKENLTACEEDYFQAKINEYEMLCQVDTDDFLKALHDALSKNEAMFSRVI